MGLFKKFADFCRRSNDRASARAAEYQAEKQASERAEQDYKNSLEACANCAYYGYFPNTCIKLNFEFNMDDVRYNNIAYKYKCNDFVRR